MTKNNELNTEIKEKFQSGFKWNLWGSILFESLKIGHNVLLMHVAAPQLYGLMGTLFAIIYLTARIADVGTAYTLAPFFNLFIKSRQNFKTLFVRYSLLPLVPLLVLSAFIISIIARHYFVTIDTPPILFVFPCLVVLETIRSFFRQFLHVTFKSKPIILAEFFLFIGYLLIIWIPYLFLSNPITLNLIFIPFLLDSIIATSFFSLLIFKFYKTLPDHAPQLPHNIWKRLANTRIFDFFLRISRDLFTTNVLTPLFAIKFGLKEAGIFYLVSTIAISIQTIIKSAIGHPGNALLATLKDKTLHEKKNAFELLSSKLTGIIIPIIIAIGFNYNSLMRFSKTYQATNTTLFFALVYILITFSDLFFILYEYMYILEEVVYKLCAIKALECALFCGIIVLNTKLSPLTMVLSLLGIRCTSLVIMSLHAFYLWQIRPTVSIKLSYLGICISVSALLSFLW